MELKDGNGGGMGWDGNEGCEGMGWEWDEMGDWEFGMGTGNWDVDGMRDGNRDGME